MGRVIAREAGSPRTQSTGDLIHDLAVIHQTDIEAVNVATDDTVCISNVVTSSDSVHIKHASAHRHIGAFFYADLYGSD